MLAGFKAVLTEVKVVTVSAFESGAIDGEHLAAVTPADTATRGQSQRMFFCDVSPVSSREGNSSIHIFRPDSRVNTGHQFHFRQEAGPVGLLREVHDHILPIGTEC